MHVLRSAKWRHSRGDPAAARWLTTCLLLFGLGVGIVATRLFAFDGLVSWIERDFSTDGQISERNRRALFAGLLQASLLAFAAAGVSLLLTARRVREFAVHYWVRDRLDPSATARTAFLTLLVTSTAGGLIIGLWVLQLHALLDASWLFAKEGPLELLTCILLLISGGFCLRAAWRKHRSRAPGATRAIAIAYFALGTILIVIGMEEISWGQTYLNWQTPESWAAINSQQETTLHNLLDQATLHVVAQRATYAFVGAAVSAALIGAFARHPFITALAPHPSTLTILLLIGYAAARFHLEISEVLFSIFAVAYCWRVWRASGAREWRN